MKEEPASTILDSTIMARLGVAAGCGCSRHPTAKATTNRAIRATAHRTIGFFILFIYLTPFIPLSFKGEGEE